MALRPRKNKVAPLSSSTPEPLSRELTAEEKAAHGSDDRRPVPGVLFSDLLDGERHVMRPGIDFGPVAGQVVDWVENAVQPDLVPGESPVLSWVNADPHIHTGGKFYVIQEGWSMAAIRLKALADVLDIDVEVTQVNHRDSAGDLVHVEYIFQKKEI